MMAFPASRLPLASELFIDNAWQPFAHFTEQGLGITRGRRDWSSRAVASLCEQAIPNPTGIYSNRLPTSVNYGKLGPGTPLRHSIRWMKDYFNRNVSNDLGSTEDDPSQPWTTSGGAASDYSVDLATGRAGILFSTAGLLRQATAGPVLLDAQVTHMVRPGVVATGAPIDQGMTLRRDNAANNSYEALVRFDLLGVMRLRINLVSGGSASNLTQVTIPGTYTATSLVWIVADISGDRIRVKAWISTDAEPVWQVDFFHGASALGAGQMGGLCARVQSGNTNVPVTLRWSSTQVDDYRFWGEVSKSRPAWDPSGTKVMAVFTAAGVLERMTAGSQPKLSALRRTALHYAPVAYWPLEDESGTTQFASALSAGPASTGTFFGAGQVTAAGWNTLAGSAPLPQMAAGSEMTFVVPNYGDTGAFSFYLPLYINSGNSSGQSIKLKHINDVETTLLVLPNVALISADGSLPGSTLWTDSLFGPSLADCTGKWILAELTGTFGGSWTFSLYDMAGNTLRALSGSSAAAYAKVVSIETSSASGGSDTTPTGIGHALLFNYLANPANITRAMSGWDQERAAERMGRVSIEAGYAFDRVSPTDDTSFLGPQPVETTAEILFRAAEADQGILYEPRNALGLAYRPRSTLYNQTGVTLVALDYGAFHVAEPFLPTDDSQLVANDVIARRYGGSFARAVEPDGALGTARIGVRPEVLDWNIDLDSRLPDMAGWRRHLGTWDEARFPDLTVKMAAPSVAGNAALFAGLAAFDIGRQASVANMPIWMPPNAVKLLAQGTTETIGTGKQWDLSFNCVPSGPYTIGVLDDAVLGHLDTAGCELAGAGWDGSAGTFTVTTTAGPLWSTSGADYPLDLDLAGQRVTVSACAGVSNPQTFTVSNNSVNGVVKAHLAGEPVQLADPMILAL